jgi:hypothetical protein
VAPDLQNWWHRFWAVCIFCCAGTSPKIPEIFPKIPDFPETPGKSPEYLGFTNKIVLSGDFQDSPIHPPLGDIKILSLINVAAQRHGIRRFLVAQKAGICRLRVATQRAGSRTSSSRSDTMPAPSLQARRPSAVFLGIPS